VIVSYEEGEEEEREDPASPDGFAEASEEDEEETEEEDDEENEDEDPFFEVSQGGTFLRAMNRRARRSATLVRQGLRGGEFCPPCAQAICEARRAPMMMSGTRKRTKT